MVYKQKGSENWWYKFTWNGKQVRESTKQPNKRVAEQIEAAHRAALAKGEVGIREKEPTPTLKDFGKESFLLFVTSTKAAKPNTVCFYKNSVENLVSLGKLADLRLDEITTEHVASFVARRQLDKVEVSTINRDVSTLRRMFHLAVEWGKVKTLLPQIKLLPGKNHRERVLSLEEEIEYLRAARAVGDKIEAGYQKALTGIRAVQRGQQPRSPDSYLLQDVVTILFDCALRAGGVLPPEVGQPARRPHRDSQREGPRIAPHDPGQPAHASRPQHAQSVRERRRLHFPVRHGERSH